ncbi:hypothetical protein AAG570_012371 [Ranatra chinensis]|uniref:Ig-like domain-containing protein n=1 Tax=Ranatra chinensis TaxID=642074 RepID=A0ABD0YKR0_9HEMI
MCQLVKMDGDFKSDQDGETASLSIGRVYPEDEGEYTCIAYNRLGKATTSACLIVDVPEEKESLVNQKLSKPSCLGSAGSTPRSTPGTTPTRSVSPCVTSELHYNGVKRSSRRLKTSSPKFYSVPHNKVVEEGETVRIQCSAAGHPSPWSTWDKDGILVSPSARIRIAERDDLRYLEITEVTAEDAGLYRVTLENEYGRVEATARLDVIGRNGRRPRAVRAWSAPRCVPSFTRRLIGSTAQVGGTFSLACDIHAAPPPVTSWYRNGELLVRSDRVIPTWDGRTARLEVENVTVEDSGVYTCVADSPMGSTRCSARLRVIETDDPGDADLRPPVVVAGLPEETAAQEGRPYELQIRVKGSEPMEVVWVKDKVEVPDCDDMRYVDYGDGRYGLRIADLFAPDAGEYSCEIFNEHGEAITTTNLTVIDDGFSEDNIELRPQALWFTRTPAPLTTSCGGSAKFSARVSWLGPNAPIFKWEVGSNPVTLQSHRFKAKQLYN